MAVRCALVRGPKLAENLTVAKHLRLESRSDAHNMSRRLCTESLRRGVQQRVAFRAGAHPTPGERLHRALDNLHVFAVDLGVQLGAIAGRNERSLGDDFTACRAIELREAFIRKMKAFTRRNVSEPEIDRDRKQPGRQGQDWVLTRSRDR
jgi:hypothetical protein